MSNYDFLTLNNFSGGENTHGSPDEIADNQTIKCQNLDFTSVGGVTTRKGTEFFIQKTGAPFSSVGYNLGGYVVTKKINNNTDDAGLSQIFRMVELEKNILADGTSPQTIIKRLAIVRGSGKSGHNILAKIPDSTSTISEYEEVNYIGTGSFTINPDNSKTLKLMPHLDYEIYNDKAYMLIDTISPTTQLYEGRYMIFDGTNVYDATNAKTDSNLAHVKNCKYIEQRGQRIFAAGNPEFPNTLFFSEPGEPTYFKTTNIIDAISDDGDIITGLKEFHGGLLVFKSKAIYAWFGYDPLNDVEFQRISVHTGTKAYRTIQQVGNYLLYLGEDGVYALQGTYKDVISTKKLTNQLDEKFKNSDIQLDHPYRNNYWYNPACAVYHNNKYIITIPEITQEELNLNLTQIYNAIYAETGNYHGGNQLIPLPLPLVIQPDYENAMFELSLDGINYKTLNEFLIDNPNVDPYPTSIYVELWSRIFKNFTNGAFGIQGCLRIGTSKLIYHFKETTPPSDIYLKIKYNRISTNTLAVLHTDAVSDIIAAESLPWSTYTGLHVSDFLKSCDGNLYMASLDNLNIIKKSETYTDCLTGGIDVELESKQLTMGAYVHNKKYKNIYVSLEALTTNATAETVDITSTVDGTSETINTALGTTLGIKIKRYKINKKGKRVSYKLKFKCLNTPITLHGFTTEYKIKKPTK